MTSPIFKRIDMRLRLAPDVMTGRLAWRIRDLDMQDTHSNTSIEINVRGLYDPHVSAFLMGWLNSGNAMPFKFRHRTDLEVVRLRGMLHVDTLRNQEGVFTPMMMSIKLVGYTTKRTCKTIRKGA